MSSMKATGIVRRVDESGRIIIPKEIRRVFGIKDDELLGVYRTEKGITFKKPEESEVFSIFRRIDELGRVILPIDMREFFKVKEDDPMEIFTSKEGITFVKYIPSDQDCVFCGELTNKYLLDKPVCGSCIDKLDKMSRGGKGNGTYKGKDR